METLPVEMLEKIAQHLSPQDLARCSVVCREWREIFNQDWMWKPHCDPELEYPLRTIPCIVAPAFVAPAAEYSTLPPISRWKLAYTRENHLRKNMRNGAMYKDENITEFAKKDVRDADFLTDTLVVVWYSNYIEILDVSVVPAAFVAKTDISVEVGKWYQNAVVSTSMLLVDKSHSFDVFSVDVINKTIELKYTVTLDRNWLHVEIVGKEYFYLCFDNDGPNDEPKLIIIDLNTGRILKEEQCPVKIIQNEKASFGERSVSATSEFVACQVIVQNNVNYKKCYKYYIYSLKSLAFLPGPVAEYEDIDHKFDLLGHWLAIADGKTLRVYNFQTRDVLLSHDLSNCVKRATQFEIKACNDCFVLLDVDSESESRNLCLQIYLPKYKTLTTFREILELRYFQIINNKFIKIYSGRRDASLWKLSGQRVKKCILYTFISRNCQINRSCTKVLSSGLKLAPKPPKFICCLW